jgi:hypothetical protein
MRVYPRFNIDTIINRHIYDLTKFGIQDTANYSLNTISNSYNDFKTFIGKITDKMNSKRKEENRGLGFSTFNYNHEISTLDKNVQNEMWCLRTLLFYQLLIICTKMMSNNDLFDQVYNANTAYKREFNESIRPELTNYKMGIFGSITPTSDIDIGIQYSGSNSNLIGLSYIVSIFEDSFLIFTGINSLMFDIETYADMMTLPNLDTSTNSEYADIFYLDTTHFSETHFNEMKPYIEASILRNYVTAKIDVEDNPSVNVENIVETFNYTDFYAHSESIIVPLDILKTYGHPEPVIDETGKKLVIDYMSSDYDTARTKYYEKVDVAEISLDKVKKQNATGTIRLTPDDVCKIMKHLATALIYRAESYTCAPTIMHVVRVLQANANNPNKYDTLEPGYCKIPNKFYDAYCDIGKYGYIISIYEQLGYIYRFYLTYSESNPDKYTHKLEKYKEKRLNHAIQMIKNWDSLTYLKGGKYHRIFKQRISKFSNKKAKTPKSKKGRNKTKRHKRKTYRNIRFL